MRRETEVMIKVILLVLVISLLVLFGPMFLEKLMEAMINSINMQAESLVDQLLK